MQSNARTVAEYLRSLPPDRRLIVDHVRSLFQKHLDSGFEETMQYGMIGYVVPHSRYPAGYHCDPSQALPCAGIASQKNYVSIYLMTLYSVGKNSRRVERFQSAWRKTGRKLDMGKCCIRIKRLEDIADDLLVETLRSVTVDQYVADYQANMPVRGKPAKTPKKLAKKTTRPKSPASRKK